MITYIGCGRFNSGKTLLRDCAWRLAFPFSIEERGGRDYVDFGQQLALKMSRLSPQAQHEMNGILRKVRSALAVYMAATSFMFKVLFLLYVIAKLFSPEQAEKKVAQQVFVIEREVYLTARSRAAYMAGMLTTAQA